METLLYTSTQAAELLQLNRQTVQRMILAGRLPALRLGRKEWRIPAAELHAMIERGIAEHAAKVNRKAKQTPRARRKAGRNA